MSGVASLWNVPETSEQLNAWSFNHMAHHRDINDAIYQQYGIVFPLYPIDPMNLNDIGTFSYWHQIMHNNFNELLGISGNDLLDVDWRDEGQRLVWLQDDGIEHLEAARILNL